LIILKFLIAKVYRKIYIYHVIYTRVHNKAVISSGRCHVLITFHLLISTDYLRCFLAFHKGQTIYFKGVLWFSWSQNYFCARNKRQIFFVHEKSIIFFFTFYQSFSLKTACPDFFLHLSRQCIFSINFGDKKFQNNQLDPDGSRYYF
jgi:hypothetical protein